MSVAIRTAVRIQDQDDAPVLGAGQDGYALTWDNASGAFVATALGGGVTDHGALTGLTPDDDHTQYALLAGRAGGQTLYGGTAANEDITIHGTSDGTRTTSYVLLQPTAGNVGIGTTSPVAKLDVSGTGHFLLASGRGVAFETPVAGYGTPFTVYGASDGYAYASIALANVRDLSVTSTKSWSILYRVANDYLRYQYNSATDDSGLSLSPLLMYPSGSVAIGGWNSADADAFTPASPLHVVSTTIIANAVTNVVTIGHDTSGTPAAGFGAGLLWQLESSTTAAQDAAQIAALWTTATHATRASALTFSTLTAGGSLTERMRINGAGNVGIGTSAPGNALVVQRDQAAQTQIQVRNDTAGGFAALSIWSTTERGKIQYNVDLPNIFFTTIGAIPFYIGTDNTIRMTVSPAGNVGVGLNAEMGTVFDAHLSSAATNTVANVVTIGHNSNDTSAAGFGAALVFNLESTTTLHVKSARVQALWNDATHASRKADLVLTAYDTSEREGLRIRGAGSEPAIGFYGVAPIERATLATGAGASVDDVITALQNLGLVKQS